MPNCNSQVIILFYFILYPFRLQLGPANVIVKFLFALFAFCILYAYVLRVTRFFRVLHLDIMLMCYVFYVILCVYLLYYVLYDLFDYNKCMTSPHQSNASCGLLFRFLTSPMLVRTYRHGLVQRQTLRDHPRARSCLCDKSLHFMHIFYFLGSLPFCMIFPLYVYPLSLCVKHDMQTCIPFKKNQNQIRSFA